MSESWLNLQRVRVNIAVGEKRGFRVEGGSGVGPPAGMERTLGMYIVQRVGIG